MSIPTLKPVYTFIGTIDQHPPILKNCAFEAFKRGHGASVPAFQSSDSEFECKESEYPWNNLQILDENYDELYDHSIPEFWKKRLIVHLLVSRDFFSVTFIPKTAGKERILYVQKGGNKDIGFNAPYFLRGLKVGENIQTGGPTLLPIGDEESIQQTTEDISEQVRPNLQICLRYFLRDETSSRLGLIFYDRGQVIVRGWIKA